MVNWKTSSIALMSPRGMPERGLKHWCVLLLTLWSAHSFATKNENTKGSPELDIILSGTELSRTSTSGKALFRNPKLDSDKTKALSIRNMEKAAGFIVRNAKTLKLDINTATTINRMLTDGMVHRTARGNPYFRSHYENAQSTKKIDTFYRWLAKIKPTALKSDGLRIAETIHHKISDMDSFPDGNGRTARLMADLALIKGGHGPVLYTSQKHYFEHGNSRSGKKRSQLRRYFYERAKAGRALLKKRRSETTLATQRAKKQSKSKKR